MNKIGSVFDPSNWDVWSVAVSIMNGYASHRKSHADPKGFKVGSTFANLPMGI